jgi:murein DD-endopeptidase MepM/ murein hydrolase activator NlpD
LRKRYYIIFVARAEDGELKKVPIPLHYAYGFVAAAIVGAFTLTGMAGSYSRMLLKTSHFNEVRSQREAIRRDYVQMEQVAHEKDIQAASLGSLASEVSVLYGLKQNKLLAAAKPIQTLPDTSASLDSPDNPDIAEDPAYQQSRAQLSDLLTSAMSGRLSRALEAGGAGSGDLLGLADAPSLWPVIGRVTSSFGEREDPLSGEGAFHTGIDIATDFGEPVHAAADGVVEFAAMGNGYGREIVLDHGHGIQTLYAHLSGFAITPGEHVTRGQTIGYVGQSGRSTGPHLHYEVRIQNTPVNPHKYLRTTMQEMAGNIGSSTLPGGGN